MRSTSNLLRSFMRATVPDVAHMPKTVAMQTHPSSINVLSRKQRRCTGRPFI